MKKIFLSVVIVYIFMSCGNGSGSAANSDSTVNSITPPPTSDTTSTMAPMMGDTSKTEADSINIK